MSPPAVVYIFIDDYMRNIAAAALFIASLVTLVPVYAQTMPSTTTQTSSYCPTLTITMVRGARDTSSRNQVTQLQKFLASYYHVDTSVLVTGYFGVKTQSYVMQFQKETGLPALGIVGQLTRSKIASVCRVVLAPTLSFNQVFC